MKQTDDKYNIIWFGSVYSASGYGAVTRPYILGLINAGINVKVVPSKRASVDKTKLDRNDVKVLEHAENAELIEGYRNILILQTAPSEWADLDIVGADYVIGQTVFETDVIPRDWLRICNSGIVDEIWLPTKFNMKSFKRVKNADTVHMPYCFDMDYYRKFGNTRKYRPFRVLYIADFTPRKNIALLIEAFRQEFGSAEQIELYIHTTSLYRQDELESFRELNNINMNNRIIINTDKVKSEDLLRLIASSSLYISVDCASGYGIPCVEAMALGTLSATVNWGGSTEFMHRDNSLLINPSGLRRVPEAMVMDNPAYISSNCAEVNVREVRRVLREAYKNINKNRRLVENARRYIMRLDQKNVLPELVSRFRYINSHSIGNPENGYFKLSYKSPIRQGLNSLNRLITNNLIFLNRYRSSAFLLKTFHKIGGVR